MSEPVRVLQVVKSLDRGGAEVLLSEVLKCTDRTRYTTAFAYFSPNHQAMVPELRAQGVEVFCLGAGSRGSMFLRTARLSRLIRDWEADLVHAHLPLAGAVARLASRRAGVPLVYTEHNVFERYHPLTRRASRLTWRLQSEVIAVSDEVGRSLESMSKRVPVTVVRNAVNVDAFTRDAEGARRVRAKLGVPHDAVLVGTVAVFRPAKRLDRWLSVARRVREREPRVRFVLVGYGPLEGDVREWVRANGLEDVVHLAGAQTDVRPWMSALDVYMMSSDFEGLPVALLEAMAMGVPVLTTSVGGIPEVVEHEQCGMLVGVDDPERGLVDLLLRMVSDRSLRERLGRAARERVEQRFGMQRMVREIQDVYDRALARG